MNRLRDANIELKVPPKLTALDQAVRRGSIHTGSSPPLPARSQAQPELRTHAHDGRDAEDQLWLAHLARLDQAVRGSTSQA